MNEQHYLTCDSICRCALVCSQGIFLMASFTGHWFMGLYVHLTFYRINFIEPLPN